MNLSIGGARQGRRRLIRDAEKAIESGAKSVVPLLGPLSGNLLL